MSAPRKENSVAIIGMSGIFPEADSLQEFYTNLRTGKDSVRNMPRERIINSTINPHLDYQVIGVLDRVDLFDHAFFNISKKEAECMDPGQRLLLQLACHAIEDSGQSLQELFGSNTGVYLGGGADSKYRQLIEEFDPTIVTGNLGAMAAGRIAYYFDFNGPALMINTACSSSLVAVHQACQAVLSEEVDYALAGGMHVLSLIHI